MSISFAMPTTYPTRFSQRHAWHNSSRRLGALICCVLQAKDRKDDPKWFLWLRSEVKEVVEKSKRSEHFGPGSEKWEAFVSARLKQVKALNTVRQRPRPRINVPRLYATALRMLVPEFLPRLGQKRERAPGGRALGPGDRTRGSEGGTSGPGAARL